MTDYKPRESKRKAFYRDHQSNYRRRYLDVKAGIDSNGNRLGSLLPIEEKTEQRGLNFFMNSSVTNYVKARAKAVRQEGGALNDDRLWRNMLSSMPLCFNLFGYLRDHPHAAARALAGTLGLDIEQIVNMEVEWAPPGKAEYLDDRTAFDAVVQYTTSAGELRFLGIETKYTDDFGKQKLEERRRPYLRIAQDWGGLLEIPDAKELEQQVWRNTLLAAACSMKGNLGSGYSVALTLGDDSAGLKALASVRSRLAQPRFLRWTCYEAIIAELEARDTTTEWASQFRRRYLPRKSFGARSGRA